MKLPMALAADAYGSVYVADQQSKFINKFDSNGRPLLAFEAQGLKDAHSIAIDTGHAIYVGGSGRGIAIFLPDGRHLRTLRRLHSPPAALAVDSDGNIFTLGTTGSLQKLNPRGKSLGLWAGPGGLDRGSATSPAFTISDNGFLFVADTGNHRIQKLTKQGEFAAFWPLSENENPAPPAVISLASYKDFLFLLALQRGQYILSVWSTDGRQILADPLGERLNPAGSVPPRIATSPKGELLVLDSSTPRVLRFRINL